MNNNPVDWLDSSLPPDSPTKALIKQFKEAGQEAAALFLLQEHKEDVARKLRQLASSDDWDDSAEDVE